MSFAFFRAVNNAMLIVGDDTNCDILFSVFFAFFSYLIM